MTRRSLSGLQCAACGESYIRHVCHHCGKPLCQNCMIEKTDTAFFIPVTAIHCKKCLDKHHNRFKATVK